MVFCGTFTAGKSIIEVKDKKLNIIEDGKFCKFVSEVEQVTFSGDYARQTGQKVLYITERAVFELTGEGFELIEIAPGVELQKHILDKMEFKPVISKNLRKMDTKIFEDVVMGLKGE